MTTQEYLAELAAAARETQDEALKLWLRRRIRDLAQDIDGGAK